MRTLFRSNFLGASSTFVPGPRLFRVAGLFSVGIVGVDGKFRENDRHKLMLQDETGGGNTKIL